MVWSLCPQVVEKQWLNFSRVQRMRGGLQSSIAAPAAAGLPIRFSYSCLLLSKAARAGWRRRCHCSMVCGWQRWTAATPHAFLRVGRPTGSGSGPPHRPPGLQPAPAAGLQSPFSIVTCSSSARPPRLYPADPPSTLPQESVREIRVRDSFCAFPAPPSSSLCPRRSGDRTSWLKSRGPTPLLVDFNQLHLLR
jgi:hypothetical protein